MDKKLTLIVSSLLALGLIAGLTHGCFFRSRFDIICPSCGLTRSWLTLFRGDLAEAFSLHPMFWFPPMAIFYCCLKKPLLSRKADLIILSVLGALYLTLYIVKLSNHF